MAHSVEFSHVIQGCSQEFNLGEGSILRGSGADKRVATSGGGENFRFEMVHSGAKVTNGVHHHWFLGEEVTVKRLT